MAGTLSCPNVRGLLFIHKERSYMKPTTHGSCLRIYGTTYDQYFIIPSQSSESGHSNIYIHIWSYKYKICSLIYALYT